MVKPQARADSEPSGRHSLSTYIKNNPAIVIHGTFLTDDATSHPVVLPATACYKSSSSVACYSLLQPATA